MAFKTGNVVQLKSGSPKMTVLDDGRYMHTCAWFDGIKEMRAEYPGDALMLAVDEPKKGAA